MEYSVSAKEDSFVPNVFVDMGEYMDKKIEPINIYESEIERCPLPKSEGNIRALAVSSCDYTEGFLCLSRR